MLKFDVSNSATSDGEKANYTYAARKAAETASCPY
jgi:hypothetical protein